MSSSIERQVWQLKICVAILGIAVIVLIATALIPRFSKPGTLTVQRINIVNPDGKPAMVISNRPRQHPGRMNNQNLPQRDRPAGIIFFNDEGDECGGLIAEGSKASADMSFTMDQYKNDQIVQLNYSQQNGQGKPERRYGLTINDRDDFSLLQQLDYFDSLKRLKDTAALSAGISRFKAAHHLEKRLFLGKNGNGTVGLFLNDSKGNPCLQIYVNEKDEAVVEAIDRHGNKRKVLL
ncbi:hypothetical protein GCM10027037_25740 [Mucilaginibacter koreensis]